MASAWVAPWVQQDPCSELLAWFAIRILPVCECGRSSSQAACSLGNLPARRGTHLLPCCDGKKSLVPTGGMPFERSVGKDTRNTFETADQSSAPCLCYLSVNMPRGIACIALHIKTSRVSPLPCSGRSEQRSDTRLSNPLADQSDGLLPINMPFPTHAP